MSEEEEAQSTLTAMGFSPERVASALRGCGGNLENAANLLLTGADTDSTRAMGSSTSPSIAAPSGTARMIECPFNQYSVPLGKSACTCIAMIAAETFLKQTEGASPKTDERSQLSAEFLQECILQGVEKYKTMSKTQPSTEHLSAEDVLNAGIFQGLELVDGGVMQGILSPDGPLGLRALLPTSQSETQWTCALITKPPETVVCCIPPTNYDGGNPVPFLLIDSHPRQQQFGAEGSYIRQHSYVEGLVQSLETLFPPTNLGPDIPELMAAMYNQFDLYRLRLRKST